MTKLSILIPTYNRRDRLEKTFPGLISNSSKDIEFIIVDNNSKDSTEEFFKKYCKKDSRIKYFKNHSNIGPNRNIYRAYLESKSDWITIFPDDDFIKKEFLDELLFEIETNNDLGLIISAKTNSVLFEKSKRINKGKEAIKIAYKHSSAITCLSFKKDIINEKIWLLDGFIYPQVKLAINIALNNDILYFVPKNKPTIGEWGDKIFELETRPKDHGVIELIGLLDGFFKDNNIRDIDLYYDLTLSKFLWSENIFYLMLIENEKKAFCFLDNLTLNNSIKSSAYFWAAYLKGSLKYIKKPMILLKIYYFFIRSIFKSIFLKNLYLSSYHFLIKIYIKGFFYIISNYKSLKIKNVNK